VQHGLAILVLGAAGGQEVGIDDPGYPEVLSITEVDVEGELQIPLGGHDGLGAPGHEIVGEDVVAVVIEPGEPLWREPVRTALVALGGVEVVEVLDLGAGAVDLGGRAQVELALIDGAGGARGEPCGVGAGELGVLGSAADGEHEGEERSEVAHEDASG
jgi:hypothetical protein